MKASEKHEVTLHSGMICKRSPIHGMGVFAPKKYDSGDDVYEVICPCGGDSCRTEACRLTNHSKDPNMFLDRRGNSVWAVARRKIPCGEECTIDYRSVMPILTASIPIGAGRILRQTPGVGRLVRDEPNLTLLDQLQAIESGNYR
jgi:hypothetical protein